MLNDQPGNDPLDDPALATDDEPGDTPAPTPEELLADRMRQADYTRKTQKLADDRRRYESEIASLRENLTRYEGYAGFDAWLEANPQAKDRIAALIQETQGTPRAATRNGLPPDIERKLAEVVTKLEEVETRAAGQEIAAAVKALAARTGIGEEGEAKVIKTLADLRFLNNNMTVEDMRSAVEAAYRYAFWNDAKATGQRDAAKQAKEKAKAVAQTLTGGQGGNAPAPSLKGMRWDEIKARAPR